MKGLCKVIIASLLVVCATKTSTAQDIKFTPQEDGEIKGTAYQQSQFGENGLMTLRRPASGGMNLKMHYLDTVNGQITSTKVRA